ncbi:unnamed protein product [Pseudo-nitzschia multistriata]|uniref:Uncharacterized protein n=1 Tax=Pseudo-nitzschia multistriata TaxID=183589 RepID=A0A448YWK2_9STRA|nr:unnamed protein product [Pseudo-nitzschia multistriata]
MSRIEEQCTSQAPLDYLGLVEKQRRLLKDVSSTPTISKDSNSGSTAEKNPCKPDAAKSNVASIPATTETEWISNWRFERVPSSKTETEWISNWRFERVPSSKKTQDFVVDSDVQVKKTKSSKIFDSSPSESQEGGIFYFQRICSRNESHKTKTAHDSYTRVSESSSDCAVTTNGDQQLPNFFEVNVDGDDLFADLEAVADSKDDSEISFDDLMDIDVEDGASTEHIQNYNGHPYSDSIYDVDGFLNATVDNLRNASLEDDEDINMMSCDDTASNNMNTYLSPVTSKASLSSTLPFGSLDSPTCVAQDMALSPIFSSSLSMPSASTRPAFQQMRKIMTKQLMDINNGSMPRSLHKDSLLPCAEGMDQMYLDTLQKLSISMARSNRTRKSLSIPLQTMQDGNDSHGLQRQQDYNNREYTRVNQVLKSVQTSSRHVDTCLQSVRMMSR